MFLFGKRKPKKEKRKIPKTVQQSIPIDRLYRDGVFKCGHTYSKTWRFSDINYAVASDDDQLSMFLAHSALINGLPTDAMAKISIFNRQLSREVLSSLATPNGEKNYAVYANELAEIFADKMADSNNIVHDKFITVSSEKKNIEESRTFFTRVGNDLTADFAKLSSRTTELGYKDRLRIFYIIGNFVISYYIKTKLNCPCEIFGFAKTHMGKQSVNTAAAARRAAQPLCSIIGNCAKSKSMI